LHSLYLSLSGEFVFRRWPLLKNGKLDAPEIGRSHASPDTVMIYAKLYPSQLIEEYRKTVRSLYNAHYGEAGLKNPTAEEWAAFATSCNLRDMGTHLCALPAGMQI
jgi:hypothetical protein